MNAPGKGEQHDLLALEELIRGQRPRPRIGHGMYQRGFRNMITDFDRHSALIVEFGVGKLEGLATGINRGRFPAWVLD